MWKKKLIMKRRQFIVLGLILCFASMILCTCLSFSTEIEHYTDVLYHNKANATHLLYATKGTAAQIAKNIKEQDTYQIETMSVYDCVMVDRTKLTHHNNYVKEYINPLFAVVLSDYSSLPFGVTPIEGDSNHLAPNQGEVWVQNAVADHHKISVNDTFSIEGSNQFLTVTTLFNDTRKPVSMTLGACIFINEQDASLFEKEDRMEYICITTPDDSASFTKYLDSIYTNKEKAIYIDTLDELHFKANMMTSLTAKLGSVAALFMLIISIVIILFFVRNTILAEYSCIGTYKSVGYTTQQITGFYLKAYSLVGAFSLLLGSLLSLPIAKFIGNIILEYIGDYKETYRSIRIIVIVFVVATIFLCISVYFALRRIRKITPVDTFRVGVCSSKSKLKKSFLPHAKTSFSMAINDIFKYKKRSSIIVIVVAITVYISLMLVNMCLSFARMGEHTSSWISMPNCNVYLTLEEGSISEEAVDYVKQNPYVKSYLVGKLFSNIPVVSKDTSLNLGYANVFNFDTYDYDITGITYPKGRAPQNKEEIAISRITLEASNYHVGDTVTLLVNEDEHSYLITGAFDTMMYPAVAFTNEAFDSFPQEQYLQQIGVNLNDENDFDAFTKEFITRFPEYKLETMTSYVDDIQVSIMSIMIPITTILIGIFSAFTLLNIINLILMNQAEQRRNFGVMKAYGFTTSYIVRRNVFRIMLLSTLGLILALLMNEWFNAKIFYSILGVSAYQLEVKESFALLFGFWLIIGITTTVLSLQTRKIAPKELMED